MKATFLLTVVQNGAKRIPMGLLFAVGVTLLHPDATAAPAPVNLGAASSFSILAGSGITDPGAASVIAAGDVGLSPTAGSAITGLNDAQVLNGTIYTVDATGPAGSVVNPSLLTTAKTDLTAAYTDAGGRIVTDDFSPIGDNQLGSKTLGPGVYRFGGAATANLIGTLTLDAQGDPNPVWIFQATSTLVTAPGSSVVMTGVGADASDVFWRVATSATLGTTTTFVGDIMADQTITLLSAATLDGSAMSRIGAVNLSGNTIVPEPGTTLLLGTGLATLFAFRRRFFPPA